MGSYFRIILLIVTPYLKYLSLFTKYYIKLPQIIALNYMHYLDVWIKYSNTEIVLTYIKNFWKLVNSHASNAFFCKRTIYRVKINWDKWLNWFFSQIIPNFKIKFRKVFSKKKIGHQNKYKYIVKSCAM